MNRLLTVFSSIFFLFFILFSVNQGLQAAVFDVTDSAGFQAALDTASANGEDDTINLAAGTYLTGGSTFTYTAAAAEDFGLTIVGDGVGQTILDGGNADQILSIDTSAIPDEEGSNVSISGITFQNGNAAGSGGGLLIERSGLIAGNQPDTTLQNCQFLNNSSGGSGGGASVEGVGGMLTIADNEFTDNDSVDDGGGLDVFNSDTGTTNTFITNNTFDNNESADEGGGYSSGATNISMTGNTFTNNTSVNEGGGADVGFGGLIAVLTGNTFIDNTSTADVGGGANVSGGGLDAVLEKNIFMGNSAIDGGGLNSSGGGAIIEAENNIFIDNTASGDGGGARFRGGGMMSTTNNNTFTLNNALGNGGGLAVIPLSDGDTTTITNNIVYDNTAGGLGGDIFVDDDEDANNVGSMVTLTFSDFTDFTTSCLETSPPCVPDITQNDNIDEDPDFRDANDGDVLLRRGSPAIDTGSNADCAAEDQRDVVRPQDGTDDGFAICDMGAIEMLLSELISQDDSGCTLAPKGPGSSLPLYMIVPAILIMIGFRRRIKG